MSYPELEIGKGNHARLDTSGLQEATIYCECPHCNAELEMYEAYKVNGQSYPKRGNYYSYNNASGYGTDWTEIHCCEYCGEECYLETGT